MPNLLPFRRRCGKRRCQTHVMNIYFHAACWLFPLEKSGFIYGTFKVFDCVKCLDSMWCVRFVCVSIDRIVFDLTSTLCRIGIASINRCFKYSIYVYVYIYRHLKSHHIILPRFSVEAYNNQSESKPATDERFARIKHLNIYRNIRLRFSWSWRNCVHY